MTTGDDVGWDTLTLQSAFESFAMAYGSTRGIFCLTASEGHGIVVHAKRELHTRLPREWLGYSVETRRVKRLRPRSRLMLVR
jgi:hypothetical protein